MRLACLAMLVFLAFSRNGRADEADSEARLQVMSREQRERLAANLARFDSLPREVQSQLREMERHLGAAEPGVRERYMTSLRSYHAFYQSLPNDRRLQLDQTKDPVKKLELVTSFRAERRKAHGEGLHSLSNALQVSNLVGRPLHRTARELILWFALDQPDDSKDRLEFAKARSPEQRRKFFQEYQKRTKKPHVRELRHDDEEFRADEKAIVDKQVRGQETRIREEAKKKHTEPKKVQEEIERLRAEFEKRSREEINKKAELKVLETHSPDPVTPENLDRFEKQLPPWFWEAVDPLPPDSARRRLKVLYRLVFPIGKEISTPKPPTTPSPAKPAPPPAASGSTPL